MVSKETHAAVVSLFKLGRSGPDIRRLLKLHRMEVKRVLDRYKQTGCIRNRKRRRLKRPVRTNEMIEAVRNRVKRNPNRSMRKMAKDLRISEKSVRRIIREDLKLVSCRKCTGHVLTAKMKEQRLEKCRRMLALVARRGASRILFTDEKIFSIEPTRNPQNDRVIRKSGSARCVEFTRNHFPAKSVMVWAGISGTGKTKLVFIDKGVKIDSKIYQELILKTEVARFARSHFKNNKWILQQDWAPAHGSKSSMEVAKQICPSMWDKKYWPSNSPDLNPMDYAIWGILESEVSRVRYTSLDSLKYSLQRAWGRIDKGMLTRTVRNFKKRLEACIEAERGHFEQLL